MHYYDPNDRSPRRWATIAVAAYVLLLGLSFAFVHFGFRAPRERGEEILIEFVEPEPPRPTPPPVRPTEEPRMHERPAPDERTAQVAGKDEVTRTPNPKALFKMNKGGVDEPESAGNPRAPEGEDKASGTGPGLNPDGLDQLDRGLQGRGLVEALPKPAYPGQKSGRVVIRVTVGPRGDVTSAVYEPKGSTLSDGELIEAARAAALKARFTESRAAVQGGTITYLFRMK